ncbi:MAG: efflux RND transporter periplasmic adaptor subunit [Acidobacteriaceae bacterium]
MAIHIKQNIRTAALITGFVVALILIFVAARMLLRSNLPVRVATAHMGDLLSTVSTNGKVEPKTNFEAHAPFPGLIKNIYVHPGQKVKAGELLLTMDDSQAKANLASAYAGLKGAQASYDMAAAGGPAESRLALTGQINSTRIDLTQAQSDLAALQKLETTGAASPSEVTAAQQRVQADQSALQVLKQRQQAQVNPLDVAHAKAALDQARQAYEAASAVLAQSNVRAPFAGTVYNIPVSKTEYVQGGALLLEVANLDHMQVLAYFDEPEIGKLALNQPVVVHWDAKPNISWKGYIARMPSTIINYGTRYVGEALVNIENKPDLLIPDTNVTLTVTVANLKNVLIVPREALHIEQGKSFVYRVVNGTLRRTSVTVGELNLTDVQIISGLKAGEVVALGATNGQPLGDGLPVKVEQ